MAGRAGCAGAGLAIGRRYPCGAVSTNPETHFRPLSGKEHPTMNEHDGLSAGTCTSVVGLHWGDEGKGKIVDLLAAEHDAVVRYNGGANAGHTVVVDGDKYALHLVPSGILYPGKLAVVGNGVVVDAEQLLREIEELEARGVCT